MPRQRPSLRWVPRDGSPASSLVWRARTPRLPRRARFARASVSLQRSEGDEVSQVPGEPSRTCPALRPRSDRGAPGHSGFALLLHRSVSPSVLLTTSAPTTIFTFGAQSHGLHARCLRFAATVTRYFLTATQDSLPAGGHLAGRDSNPLGSDVRFRLSTSRPPHPGFAWRTRRSEGREVCRSTRERSVAHEGFGPDAAALIFVSLLVFLIF